MYRKSGSSMRNLAKGSASLWLQRKSIKYVTLDTNSEVKKYAPESLLSNNTEDKFVDRKSTTESGVASGDSEINRLVKSNGSSSIVHQIEQTNTNNNNNNDVKNNEIKFDAKSTVSDIPVVVDSNIHRLVKPNGNKITNNDDVKNNKDKEIELLKIQLRMAEEKNSQIEISFHEMKEKNTNLQQHIVELNEEKETDKTMRLLQDLLSSKTNQLLKLQERFDMQSEQYQTCQKELNEVKNQLYYKRLALDGIIKSNIKLQEQLDASVTDSVDKKRSTQHQQQTVASRVLTGHLKSDIANATDKKKSTHHQQKNIMPVLATDHPSHYQFSKKSKKQLTEEKRQFVL